MASVLVEDMLAAATYEVHSDPSVVILEIRGSAETRKYFVRTVDLPSLAALFCVDAIEAAKRAQAAGAN